MNFYKAIFALLLFFNLKIIAQENYVKGYIIDNLGKKTECLIEDNLLYDNPTQFQYKLNDDSEVKFATVNNIKEICIENKFKYIKSNVNIDESSIILSKLTYKQAMEYKERVLFLRELIKGKASLYSYSSGEGIKFFFQNEHNNLQQIEYKQYTDGENALENNRFRQQLFNALKNEKLDKNDFLNLKYEEESFVRIFEKYNGKSEDEIEKVVKKSKVKMDFNLNLRPRYELMSMSITDPAEPKVGTLDFGKKQKFNFRAEFEFVFSFDKSRWAIIIEPGILKYKGEAFEKYTKTISTINYTVTEFPFGVRRYFYLNDKSQLFVNGSIGFFIDSKKSIMENQVLSDYQLKSQSLNYNFGLGYRFNKKFIAEVNFRPNTISDYSGRWSSKFSITSIVLGYSLF